VSAPIPSCSVGFDQLAHRQGGKLNASDLGASLGVTHHTVRRYLDILEQTYLLRRLQPTSPRHGPHEQRDECDEDLDDREAHQGHSSLR
jgi:predicted AAA+ superfamily ATPase